MRDWFKKNLSSGELRVFKRLNSPQKVQDFLETIQTNFESGGETVMSPRRVLREKKAHCMEAALFAAAVFLFHGRKPLLLDLRASKKDLDHVVALFNEGEKWGAISKSNHATIRYRDAVYKSPRELALSYFHEYFSNDGTKNLRSFSKPFDLRSLKQKDWITAEEDLWYIDRAMNKIKHTKIVTKEEIKKLRKADPIERRVGKLTTWKKPA